MQVPAPFEYERATSVEHAMTLHLVSTILALRRITAGLDQAIAGVVGIIEKSAPVGDVVKTINANLDAGVDLLEGLLVKKAGLSDSTGLLEGRFAGSASAGLRNFPQSGRCHRASKAAWTRRRCIATETPTKGSSDHG